MFLRTVIALIVIFVIVALIGFGIYMIFESSGPDSGSNNNNTTCPVVPYSQSGITETPALANSGNLITPNGPTIDSSTPIGWAIETDPYAQISLMQKIYDSNGNLTTFSVGIPINQSGMGSYLNTSATRSSPLYPGMEFYIIINSAENPTKTLTVPSNINPNTDIVLMKLKNNIYSASVCSSGYTPITS